MERLEIVTIKAVFPGKVGNNQAENLELISKKTDK